MGYFIRILISVSLAATLAACSGIQFNEGANRVRTPITNAENTEFRGLFFNDDTGRTPFDTGDAISINLISAHICDFRESSYSGIGSGEFFNSSNDKSKICTGGGDGKTTSSKRHTRGEILIIAQANEMTGTDSLTFDMSKLRDHGRVIYYNSDIRESGQLINALNIPIYGPQIYNGYPFALDLAILELDNEENEKIKGLLGQLAAIGKTVSAPSNGPLLDVLNALGSTLISGNGDDVEFRYQLVSDIKGHKKSKIHRMPLAEGYLALIREEHRSDMPEWHKVCVDRESGLIRHKAPRTKNHNPDDCGGDVYRERTWLLIRIANEDKDSPAVLKARTQEKVADFVKRSSELSQFRSGDYGLQDAQKALDNALQALQPKVE